MTGAQEHTDTQTLKLQLSILCLDLLYFKGPSNEYYRDVVCCTCLYVEMMTSLRW